MRTAKKKTTNNNKQKQKPVGVTWQKKKKNIFAFAALFLVHFLAVVAAT